MELDCLFGISFDTIAQLCRREVLTHGPRYEMIADGALSHLAHHRGQLTVYLRLNEMKVPAIYGPSADEWH